MPINPHFKYSGQPWAWPVSLLVLAAATTFYIYGQPSNWLMYVAFSLMGLAPLPIMHRMNREARTYRIMVEDQLAINIGRALIESNLDAMKLPRRMPSDILKEAVDGIEAKE